MEPSTAVIPFQSCRNASTTDRKPAGLSACNQWPACFTLTKRAAGNSARMTGPMFRQHVVGLRARNEQRRPGIRAVRRSPNPPDREWRRRFRPGQCASAAAARTEGFGSGTFARAASGTASLSAASASARVRPARNGIARIAVGDRVVAMLVRHRRDIRDQQPANPFRRRHGERHRGLAAHRVPDHRRHARSPAHPSSPAHRPRASR